MTRFWFLVRPVVCIGAYIATSAGVLPAEPARSVVQPASIFTDNMVLQRDKPVPVWGTAEPGAEVTVMFAGQEKSATADAEGKWRATLEPLKTSKEGRVMTIRTADDGDLALTNILVGEVWLCSGQSNMEWVVSGSANYEAERADADQRLIRHFKVPRSDRSFPAAKVDAKWVECTPATAGDFTAAGYFFAREILRELDVPVGIVNSSFGGTCIEAWTSPGAFLGAATLPELAARVRRASPQTAEGKTNYNSYLSALENWLPRAKQAVDEGSAFPAPPDEPWITGNEQQPTRLYNGMLAPLVPYALRGVLWYQGEANVPDPARYAEKMAALVDGWRKLWCEPQLPFYYVQLAGFAFGDAGNPRMGDGWARLRDEQLKAMAIPQSGMAVAIDIGEAADIHPKNKQEIGRRLARWALAKTYGRNTIPCGPVYRSHHAGEGKITVEFDHADSGLFIGKKEGAADPIAVADGELGWISIAGADKVFRWAKAVVDHSRLVVWNTEAPEPVAVRYAFTQNPEGLRLYNKAGLPASPFRTDDWWP